MRNLSSVSCPTLHSWGARSVFLANLRWCHNAGERRNRTSLQLPLELFGCHQGSALSFLYPWATICLTFGDKDTIQFRMHGPHTSKRIMVIRGPRKVETEWCWGGPVLSLHICSARLVCLVSAAKLVFPVVCLHFHQSGHFHNIKPTQSFDQCTGSSQIS